MSAWAVAEESKACGVLFDRAWSGEPQIIMRDQAPALVVITYAAYQSLLPRRKTLFQTLRECPYGDMELKIDRDHHDYGRKVAF